MKPFAHVPNALLQSAALSAIARCLAALLLLLASSVLASGLASPARAVEVIIDNHADLDASNTTPDDDLIIRRNVDHSPIVNLLAGGHVGSAQTYNDAILLISGGTIARDAMAFEDLQIALFSGAVVDDLRSFDNAVILVFGGSVGAGIVEASHSSVISIEGGQILSDLHAQDSAIIQVFGTNLALSGTLLTGTLRDGTPISRSALTSGDGLIILHNVPEPNSLMMLGTALAATVGIARRRRTRRQQIGQQLPPCRGLNAPR